MNIGLIGFGAVGKAFIRLLLDKREALKKQYKLDIKLKYILKSDGGIYSPEGIEIEELVEYIKNDKGLENHKLWKKNTDVDLIIKNNDIDTIVELTSTNVDDGQPGLTHIEKALDNGINVVTGNKGPILLSYKELHQKAKNNKVKLMVGCTTGGALPSIAGGLYGLAGSDIISIEGILNGTSNYILTAMAENKIEYEEALNNAQAIGIAEANPTLDVEGYDTASKIIILSNILLDTNLKLSDIEVQGITNIGMEEILKLKDENKKIKLIGKIEKVNNYFVGYVKPMILSGNHPLYYVDDKNKGVYYKTDTLGDISFIGGASGTMNAAAAILRDILITNGLE